MRVFCPHAVEAAHDMDTLYPDGNQPVNPPIFGIPLEVAQDHELSDGAVLLFGEVYGLVRTYGVCTALDPHFQERRGKSRSTIQAQIKELRDRGYVYVITDKHTRREIRVPQRLMGSKDGDKNCPGNRKDGKVPCPGNRKDTAEYPENGEDAVRSPENETPHCPENATGGCPENKTHKTPESEDEESKSPDSESGNFRNSISEDKRQKAHDTWELFKSNAENGSVREYEGLMARCPGREECFDIGVLSARKAQDGGTLQMPVPYIRAVIDRHLKDDKGAAQAFWTEMRRGYETPAQRREIDDRERRLAAEKAAHMAPPPPVVSALLTGAVQGMPQDQDLQTRIKRPASRPSARRDADRPAACVRGPSRPYEGHARGFQATGRRSQPNGRCSSRVGARPGGQAAAFVPSGLSGLDQGRKNLQEDVTMSGALATLGGFDSRRHD